MPRSCRPRRRHLRAMPLSLAIGCRAVLRDGTSHPSSAGSSLDYLWRSSPAPANKRRSPSLRACHQFSHRLQSPRLLHCPPPPKYPHRRPQTRRSNQAQRRRFHESQRRAVLSQQRNTRADSGSIRGRRVPRCSSTTRRSAIRRSCCRRCRLVRARFVFSSAATRRGPVPSALSRINTRPFWRSWNRRADDFVKVSGHGSFFDFWRC